MNITKIKSYYGFAYKSNGLVAGLDNILKKKCYLIVVDESLAQNSKNKCENRAKELNIKIAYIKTEYMCDITQNSKILAFGISNKDLASAIYKNLEIVEE